MHQKKSGFRRSQYCFVIVRTRLIKQLKWLAGKIGKRLPLLERKVESSSPIKIHKYQLKKNERSEKNYLILNKNSKIIKPDDSKRDFDYAPLKTEPTQAIDTTTEKNHYGDAYTLVNITGHLTFNGSEETLQVKGKTLTKQEAVFTDNTGSICVVGQSGFLWEKHIPRVTSGTCYNIKTIAVKECGDKYLTLTKHSRTASIPMTKHSISNSILGWIPQPFYWKIKH